MNRLAAAGLIAVLAVAVAFPVLFPSPVATNYGVYALIFVAVASAWNVFSGFSGYISLGHAVFFGSGAYALGIAARDWHVAGVGVFGLLPLAALVGGLIAVPFGLVALRVRRHTFIVITIAVFFIFQLMAYNFSFTGGSSGLDAPFLPWQAATYNNPFYYMALACAVGTIALAWLIRRSRFGLQLRAIRDDEDRARGLGVHAMRLKLAAFVLSGAVTALVGGLWFLYLTQVQPPSGFDPLFDLSVVLMAFLGGLGTVSGPVLGALIIEPGQLYLTVRFTNGYLSEILLGALFLVAVLLVPRGIIPTGGEWIRRLTTRGAGRTGRSLGGARCAAGAGPGTRAGGQHMSVLLRTDGVHKSYGGVQALDSCTVEVDEGTIAGLIGPNGSGKTTLFNVITGYAKADAGEVYLAGRQDHQQPAGQGVCARHRADLPADQDLPQPNGAGEHAGRIPALAGLGPQATRWNSSISSASRGTTPRWPERCPTASASSWKWPTCWSRTRPSSCSTSRRRRQPVAGQPHRRPHPRAERGGQDLPHRRAQHGVRDGALRSGHRARLGHRGGRGAARHRPDRPPGPRRLPRRGPGR